LDNKSAILSDITTPANRAKALAHVGIAFAICFCIGPPIGAYFASQPVIPGVTWLGTELNVYAAPAILTLVLLVAETAFLAVALPETRGKRLLHVQSSEKSDARSAADRGGDAPVAPVRPAEQRIKILKFLRMLHFLFLGVFSGVEFTLTFLTFDRT
jgi:MFS family permease